MTKSIFNTVLISLQFYGIYHKTGENSLWSLQHRSEMIDKKLHQDYQHQDYVPLCVCNYLG